MTNLQTFDSKPVIFFFFALQAAEDVFFIIFDYVMKLLK